MSATFELYEKLQVFFPCERFVGVLFDFDEWDFPQPEEESRFFHDFNWQTFPINEWQWQTQHFDFFTQQAFRLLLPLLIRMSVEAPPSELAGEALSYICFRLGNAASRSTLSSHQLSSLVEIFAIVAEILGDDDYVSTVNRIQVRLNAILLGHFRD